jgi:hypothetical protein
VVEARAAALGIDVEGLAPGPIVDARGLVVGQHAGVHRVTIGQRRGLRVAGSEPRYVLRVVPERREVVVGDAAALQVMSAGDRGLSPAGAAAGARGGGRGGADPAPRAADRRDDRDRGGAGGGPVRRAGGRGGAGAGGGGLCRSPRDRGRVDRGGGMTGLAGGDWPGCRIRRPNSPAGLGRLAARLGHTFVRPALLRAALTLPSSDQRAQSAGWPSNACLEFLGDAVLDLVDGRRAVAAVPGRSARGR